MLIFCLLQHKNNYNNYVFLSYLESVRTLMVPWLQRICEHASKVEDKTLPLLAQHWARISRTIQSKLQASVKLPIRCNYILLLLILFPAHLRDGEKDWFVEYFYSLASLGSAHQTIKDSIRTRARNWRSTPKCVTPVPSIA